MLIEEINFGMEFVRSRDTGKGQWVVEGYATTVDIGTEGFIITKEAIKSSEEDLLNRPTVLFNHDNNRPIGKVLAAEADDKGLLVRVAISKTEPDLWAKVKDGTINKFSVRGKVIDAYDEFNEELGRSVKYITRMELVEVSLVSVPAVAQAKVLNWKVEREVGEEVIHMGMKDPETPNLAPPKDHDLGSEFPTNPEVKRQAEIKVEGESKEEEIVREEPEEEEAPAEEEASEESAEEEEEETSEGDSEDEGSEEESEEDSDDGDDEVEASSSTEEISRPQDEGAMAVLNEMKVMLAEIWKLLNPPQEEDASTEAPTTEASASTETDVAASSEEKEDDLTGVVRALKEEINSLKSVIEAPVLRGEGPSQDSTSGTKPRDLLKDEKFASMEPQDQLSHVLDLLERKNTTAN